MVNEIFNGKHFSRAPIHHVLLTKYNSYISLKNNKRKSSIPSIFAKLFFLLSSKEIIEIIEKLLYRKRHLDFEISQKHVEISFPDKTRRLDDAIKRIKEIISFILILHSTVGDTVEWSRTLSISGLYIYYEKKPTSMIIYKYKVLSTNRC